MNVDFTKLDVKESLRRLEECALHMEQGHAIYMPDAIRTAANLIILLDEKVDLMEKALYRAEDELTAWFGEPEQANDQPQHILVEQTFSVADTVKAIREALGE